MEIRDNTPSDLRQDFLKEYSAEESIRRYMKKTAGHGISYLLEHDYGDIYLERPPETGPRRRADSKFVRLEGGFTRTSSVEQGLAATMQYFSS